MNDLTLTIITYATHIFICLVGVMTKIVYDIKKESDKFQDTRATFKAGKYINKNIWDFIFYALAGLITLATKSLMKEYVSIEGITDHSLSALSGLIGSVVISKLLAK